MIDSYLRMYTVQEVSDLFRCLPADIEMLSEVGCLNSIRIGDKKMFSFENIKHFQKDYSSFDLSTRAKAREAFITVQKRGRIK